MLSHGSDRPTNHSARNRPSWRRRRHWTRFDQPSTAVVDRAQSRTLKPTLPPRAASAGVPFRLIKNERPDTTTPFPGLHGNELFIATFKTLAQALEAKDSSTAGHSFRVSAYARAIARELGLSQGEVEQIALAAELHDIGKIGVPERLLNKRSALLPSEYRQIMEHTVEGERILKPLFQDYPVILSIVRGHHERVDGRGLPDGKRGDEIPLPTKIVTVADAFDAITSERWYRPARSVRFALDELHRKAGTQFDSECVAAFASVSPARRSDKRSPRAIPVVDTRAPALGIA